MRTVVVVEIAAALKRKFGERGRRNALCPKCEHMMRRVGIMTYRAASGGTLETAVAATIGTLGGGVRVGEVAVAAALRCITEVSELRRKYWRFK